MNRKKKKKKIPHLASCEKKTFSRKTRSRSHVKRKKDAACDTQLCDFIIPDSMWSENIPSLWRVRIQIQKQDTHLQHRERRDNGVFFLDSESHDLSHIQVEYFINCQIRMMALTLQFKSGHLAQGSYTSKSETKRRELNETHAVETKGGSNNHHWKKILEINLKDDIKCTYKCLAVTRKGEQQDNWKCRFAVGSFLLWKTWLHMDPGDTKLHVVFELLFSTTMNPHSAYLQTTKFKHTEHSRICVNHQTNCQ